MSASETTHFFKDEIQALRASLDLLPQPWLLTLEGPLGAGKTTFTKEWLSSFGFASASVQSPTFLKILEYRVPELGRVLHLDGYRIDDPEEWGRLALESYDDAAMWIVEWPQSFAAYLRARPDLRAHLAFKNLVEIKIDAGHGLTWNLSDHTFKVGDQKR